MHVLALRIELRLPGAQSLKEKRATLRPILDGARHRFPVSLAEVDRQDSWQRATLGVSAVSSSATKVAQMIDDVERFVWSFPDIEILDSDRHWLELD